MKKSYSNLKNSTAVHNSKWRLNFKKTSGSFTHTVSGILWVSFRRLSLVVVARTPSPKTHGSEKPGVRLRGLIWGVGKQGRRKNRFTTYSMCSSRESPSPPASHSSCSLCSFLFSFEGDPQTWSHHSEFSRLPKKSFNDIINYINHINYITVKYGVVTQYIQWWSGWPWAPSL